MGKSGFSLLEARNTMGSFERHRQDAALQTILPSTLFTPSISHHTLLQMELGREQDFQVRAGQEGGKCR